MACRLLTIAAPVALVALTSCSSINYEDSSPLTTPEPTSVQGIEVPDSEPIREPFTTYLKVLDAGATVGYVVRYDPLPAGSDLKRQHREGTMFVEDRQFNRIGFITYMGRGYRYEGADADEIGQGTLEQLLPRFFDAENLEVADLH